MAQLMQDGYMRVAGFQVVRPSEFVIWRGQNLSALQFLIELLCRMMKGLCRKIFFVLICPHK